MTIMRLLIVMLIAVSGTSANAQTFIEPVIGYQRDLNKSNFELGTAGLSFSFKKSRRYELLLSLQVSKGVTLMGNDSAFTANPTLPLYTIAGKRIAPESVSFSLGHRIVLNANPSPNKFGILLFTGLSFQKFSVNYSYDKDNYTVLNPALTQRRSGIYVSGGFEYMRMLKYGRVLAQFLIASPPSGKESKYPGAYHAMAPLTFNMGYSVQISKERKRK